ncbi:uridine diphosphate glucose pyrophosphatase-like protein [Dinothrombium tinctorium]|uniref:Uridine diphosphate glucose pyrophosphatase-like protein n=1 Tax=Dinothrombium tinctorium TaxID=1965070 RepID=A0A3S3RL11_9ACAR|nr:uridine diphosphate glucose pyrophosphatase-like protein [Dinothrombium tinctorium]RWS06359.1 uridine diphosphate glucose pyrophosphatase-like protein [Dinothrombium tinctorium]
MASIGSWRVEPLDSSSSRYVKPVRLHYVQFDIQFDCFRCLEWGTIIVGMYQMPRQLRPAVVFASAKSFDLETGSIEVDPNISGFTLELCAGIIDKPGKTREEIAKEEILEETGYDVPVSSLHLIFSCRSGVGVTGSLQTNYFVVVNDNQRVNKGGGVGDEQIDIVE